jgi:hypothetical protein
MNIKLGNTFKKIAELEPSPDLFGAIFRQIELEKAGQIRRKLRLVYAGFTGSIAALILAVLNYGNTVLKSDFWNMVKLAISDTDIVAGHFNSFIYSLLENFPVAELIVILIPVLVILVTLSYYFKINNNNHYKFI